jgi:hypothetical protein
MAKRESGGISVGLGEGKAEGMGQSGTRNEVGGERSGPVGNLEAGDGWWLIRERGEKKPFAFQLRHYSPEDGDSIFLRNAGICR